MSKFKQSQILKENDKGYPYIGKYSKKKKFQLVDKETGILSGVLRHYEENLENKLSSSRV